MLVCCNNLKLGFLIALQTAILTPNVDSLVTFQENVHYPAVMASEQQQYFLKWNDFQTNMVSSFKHLRDEKSFTDVTLACEGQTCKAHKMVRMLILIWAGSHRGQF